MTGITAVELTTTERSALEQVRSGRPQPRVWTELHTAQLNRGDHASTQDIVDALRLGMKDVPVTSHQRRRFALVSLNEMYSVPGILDDLGDDGWGVWSGDREGSRADPVIWDPAQFDVWERWTEPLLPAARRAGKRNMAKNLNLVRGLHIPSRRRLCFGSWHNIQTNYIPGRVGPATRFIENGLSAVDPLMCATILSGDLNGRAERSRTMAPLRRAEGWRCDQIVDRPIPTRKGSPIDMQWFCDRDLQDDELGGGVLRYMDHWTVPVRGTDHDLLAVSYKMLVRPRMA